MLTLYLLMVLGGEQRKISVYAEYYMEVFPSFAGFENKKFTFDNILQNCYKTRSVRRFTDWFGFTTSTNKKFWEGEDETVSTGILEDIFIRPLISE